MRQLNMFGGNESVEDEYKYSYVAKKPCGCIIAAGVDCPSMRKTLEEEMPKWIFAGYKVERVLSEEVRLHFWGKNCPHDPPEGDSANGS